MSCFTLELHVVAAAPALANAALLMAEGCAFKYIEVLNTLYLANSLPCPNLNPLLTMKNVVSGISPISKNPKQTLPRLEDKASNSTLNEFIPVKNHAEVESNEVSYTTPPKTIVLDYNTECLPQDTLL